MATRSVEYPHITYGSAKKPSSDLIRITGGSLGFSKIMTANLNFAIGSHNSIVYQSQSGWFQDTLEDAKKIHIVLMDTETRRSWHLDAERLILQVILHRYMRGNLGPGIEIDFADPRDFNSVRRAMLQNAGRVVRQDFMKGQSEKQDYRFADMVQQLYAIIAALREKVESLGKGWSKLRMSVRKRMLMGKMVQGWQYMDLVEDRHELRMGERKLHAGCGNWPELMRAHDAIVLFVNGLKDAFWSAGQSCHRYATVPAHNDYLAIMVPALQQFYYEQGFIDQTKSISRNRMQWFRAGDLFQICPCMTGRDYSACKCERVQELHFGNLKPRECVGLQDIDGEEAGAVIFGSAKPPALPMMNGHGGSYEQRGRGGSSWMSRMKTQHTLRTPHPDMKRGWKDLHRDTMQREGYSRWSTTEETLQDEEDDELYHTAPS
ncbi:hypothetical protein AAFC00_005449 [Neodothiora populina]